MTDYVQLSQEIKQLARRLGFADLRVSDVDLSKVVEHYKAWIQAGYHGDMTYMERHGSKRYRPDELVPGTVRVLIARMDYLSPNPKVADHWREKEISHTPETAVISMYARGRDYHKVLRQRLQQLAEAIATKVGPFGHRVFTDSAPVMEVALAQKSGLGWRGKHSLLLTREAGSLFFLGEILVDLPLPVDEPVSDHCGQCQRCIDVCPTQAIVAPYLVDARRCISYLTIESHAPIPVELRQAIGNRVYGCDDCQLVCPWNKFAQLAVVDDFAPRHGLDRQTMLALFAWSEEEFLRKMEGSPIRRIGYERWLRNLAVGLGNLASSKKGEAAVVSALQARLSYPSELVREHVIWALQQHA